MEAKPRCAFYRGPGWDLVRLGVTALTNHCWCGSYAPRASQGLDPTSCHMCLMPAPLRTLGLGLAAALRCPHCPGHIGKGLHWTRAAV